MLVVMMEYPSTSLIIQEHRNSRPACAMRQSDRSPELKYSSDVTMMAGDTAELTCIFTYYSSRREGEYVCEAKLGLLKTVSGNVKLKIIAPPDFLRYKAPVLMSVPSEQNAVFHCGANSHEAYMKPPVWMVNSKPLIGFLCYNIKSCLQENQVCDGKNNCGDGSDELGCPGGAVIQRAYSVDPPKRDDAGYHNENGVLFGDGCLTPIDKIELTIALNETYYTHPGSVINVGVDAIIDGPNIGQEIIGRGRLDREASDKTQYDLYNVLTTDRILQVIVAHQYHSVERNFTVIREKSNLGPRAYKASALPSELTGLLTRLINNSA
ncbi:hypothetical protein DPMN_072975 [Dreissena polymorpha]|uniref:Uncharacterized protein n=1 Tax=Dreissena polymorpha TaxID=45954 RepID=A0A9D4HA81_DREPO|nr:hypothetical protein DPMN_072975 [Dreissena polymorpha]